MNNPDSLKMFGKEYDIFYVDFGRGSPGGNTYEVILDGGLLGRVYKLKNGQWEYSTINGLVSAGYASRKDAGRQLLKLKLLKSSLLGS